LQFTVELENKGSLNFLDLFLIVSGDTLVLDWYVKDTCSGRYLSYYSSHPLCHKIGMIYSLVDKAMLLSHPIFHQKNLKYVIGVLIDNVSLDSMFTKINIRMRELIRRKTIKKLEH